MDRFIASRGGIGPAHHKNDGLQVFSGSWQPAKRAVQRVVTYMGSGTFELDVVVVALSYASASTTGNNTDTLKEKGLQKPCCLPIQATPNYQCRYGD
jgi:hypothetical protein